MRGCSGGACVVAPGGVLGCSRGVCVVAARVGACMVAPVGACVVAPGGGRAWFFSMRYGQ